MKEWSRSIGSAGQTHNLLTPVYGDQIYAADVEGLVVSMDRLTGRSTGRRSDTPVSGGVGAGYGLVLAGTLRGEVLALDVSTGEGAGAVRSAVKCWLPRPSMATSFWCRRRMIG